MSDITAPETRQLSFYDMQFRKRGNIRHKLNSRHNLKDGVHDHFMYHNQKLTLVDDRLYIDGKLMEVFSYVENVWQLSKAGGPVIISGDFNQKHYTDWLKELLQDKYKGFETEYLHTWGVENLPIMIGDRKVGEYCNGVTTITDPAFLASIERVVDTKGKMHMVDGYSRFTVEKQNNNRNNRNHGEHYPTPILTVYEG